MTLRRGTVLVCAGLLFAAACSGKGKQEVPQGDCCPSDGDVLADAADVATPPADVAPGEGVELLPTDVVPAEVEDLVVPPEVGDLVVPPDAADTLDGQAADNDQSTELPPGCCYKDEDCDTGVDMAFVCGFLTPASDQGVCLPLAQPGECWDKGDCKPGEDCQGPTFCECETLCGQIQAPGKCVVLPTPEVCKVDSQCPAGTRCVGKPFCDGPPGDCPDSFGTCLPLTPGLCWGAIDCVAGQVCVNAVYCQGGKVCLVDEHPGVCLDTALNGCWADGDCAPPINGTVFKCTGQWVIPWWTGNDYDAELDQEGECCGLKPGTCYEDEDCRAGQECQGAVYPYTGACGDDADDEKPGQCVDLNPWPDELCVTDAECKAGESCIGEWSCPPGTLCLDPEYPGLCLENPVGALEWCYEVQQCEQGKSCGGPWVCDVLAGEMCGGIMATPGQCQPISYPPADLGEPCGPDGGQCKAGLACCYPCGIQGCLFTCSTPCDPEEPWCADGCAMVP